MLFFAVLFRTAAILSILANTTRPPLLPQFYARDEYDEAEVVQVHPLGSLVLARFLRLQFRTDVLSFGNDTKCLRLEILGCPEGGWCWVGVVQHGRSNIRGHGDI